MCVADVRGECAKGVERWGTGMGRVRAWRCGLVKMLDHGELAGRAVQAAFRRVVEQLAR